MKVLAIFSLLVLLGGCSAEQLYGAVQSEQRARCAVLADSLIKERCTDKANVPYHAYQQDMPK